MTLLKSDQKLYALKKSTFPKSHNRYAIQCKHEGRLCGLNPDIDNLCQIYHAHLQNKKNLKGT